MRKFSIVLLSVLLLIVFVGCDSSVETMMGKMGNNLAGTDKKYIANIIQQTAPAAAEKKIEDGKITIAGSNFSISVKGSEGSIKVGNQSFELPGDLSDAIGEVFNNSSYNSIILPSDISDIVLGVKSGSNSEIIKEELKKEAEGSSLEAAQGTVALVKAMLGKVEAAVADDDPEGGFDEKIEEIIGFLPDKDSSITNGDVVVLTALSNIVFNENVLSNVGIIMNEPKAPEKDDPEDPNYKPEEWDKYNKDKETYSDAMKEVTGEMMNQFSSLLDVVTNVPSGMSNKINDFINDLMDSSNNKEKAE